MERSIDRKEEDMSSLTDFEDKIGYHFKNQGLLRQALTHSSYANERHMKKLSDNERLEFLGDAVLEIISSDFLYHNYPDVPEGQLEIILYIKQHVYPQNLKILSDKKAENVVLEAYTAYFGEDTDSLVGELTAKKLLKNLKLLDEAQAEAVIVLKDSDIYLQNQEFWDKQNIVFENETGMLVGPANATWEESK